MDSVAFQQRSCHFKHRYFDQVSAVIAGSRIMGLQKWTRHFDTEKMMDEYSVIADILETLGRWIALSLALLLSGIALGLLASLTPVAEWATALADQFVWLVELVL